MQEGPEPLPRCDQCGMHMPESRILKHRYMDKFSKATERQTRQRHVEMTARCGNM